MRARPTRRNFLAAVSSGIAATGFTRAAGPQMKLSLSVRIAEAPGSKEKTIMGFEDLVQLAKTNGYEAVCMRASQGGIQTPKERLRQMRRTLDAAGLKVSMVTGDFAVPANDENGPRCLRNITPYLDLAATFAADLIRVCMEEGGGHTLGPAGVG